ncbi:MAG TPA: low affinity iron permease family protein [Steroidobacteraceae bacterium]|nr:low affinity iron permease family protein [Steroidobacteraceae bacterium]
MKNSSWFTRFAKKTAQLSGRPMTFCLAVAVIVVWLATGPMFDYSDTWQLIINTGTTIITFLMVFLIQNTQNRDTAAIQVKLDELIRVTEGHNALMDLEELEEAELEAFRRKYERLAAKARELMKKGARDTDSPEP